MVLAGDQANEKLRYPCRELSSDIAKRYRSLGRNVDVNAIRKACKENIGKDQASIMPLKFTFSNIRAAILSVLFLIECRK